MKNHLVLIATLAAIVVASACNKKDEPEKPAGDKTVELTVCLTPFTKAIMGADGSLLWKSGDEIGVWDGQSVQKCTVHASDIIGNSTSATIKLTVPSTAKKLVFVFPYDEEDSFSSDGYLTTGAARVELGSELRTQIKAVGTCGVEDSQVVLTNFNTILKFEILSDLVKGISLEGNGGERLLCRAKVNPSDPCNGYSVVSANYDKLYLTNMSGKGTYYLGLMPGVNLPKGWTIQVFNKISMSRATLLGEVKVTEPFSLSAGRFADLGKLEYVEPEVIKNANSYWIAAPGKYSLALCKGNSEAKLDAVSSVAVLWETVCTTTAPEKGTVVSEVSLNEETGTLDYTVTSTPGNALVAALDASGNILWSWHIWNAQQEMKTETLSNGRVVLDRNIGALSTDGAGLMYQWGRKDPFLGASAPNANGKTIIKATAAVNNAGPVQSSETTGTVEYTILNPMQWIQSVQESSWDWFFKRLEDSLWGAEKTIYDPCPAGFRVPDTSVWKDVTKLTWPLSGRLGGNGKSFNVAPGSGTYYWASNAPGSGATNANALFIDTDGSASDNKSTRGVGLPIRCVKE